MRLSLKEKMLLELKDKVYKLFSAENFEERMVIMDDIMTYIYSYQLSGASMDRSFRKLISSQINSYAEEPSKFNKQNVLSVLTAIRIGNQSVIVAK